GPLLDLAARLAGQVGVQRLEFLVILLGRREFGNRVLPLLSQAGLLLGDGGFAALPVLLQGLQLGEQGRALVAQALELGFGLIEVGALLPRFFELRLEELAVGLELGLGGLGPLLQPGDVGDQALPLHLPLVAGNLERVDLGLHRLQLVVQLRGRVGQPRLVLGELGPGLLPLLLELRLPGDRRVSIFQEGLAIHGPLQLGRLQAIQVVLRGLEVGPGLLLVRLVFLREQHPFLFELAELAAALLVARLCPRDVILEAAQLHLGPIVALLQVDVPLLERFMLAEQRLAVHRPLQLGVLQLVELLLLRVELTLDRGQLLRLLGQLTSHVVLQRLEVGNELLVLLQDVGEGLWLGCLGAHQAAFRPCWRYRSTAARIASRWALMAPSWSTRCSSSWRSSSSRSASRSFDWRSSRSSRAISALAWSQAALPVLR